ncbi:asparagine--tRNA ligase [endosymbiont of Euscepes postfasciatus]|uniref:asparagine--tRNA ligase n=1 Tax=endosymbiont of Euscepes postfasciatus TaxID=650377 RepID=UPI000DC6DA90|nr:asparagine--tRNA ligase [endosymbiont of Euscepes postfasciatus]BBA84639.1 asparagine--tRNA ligase [endosymbiont of Euscepes postfasciatus]
MKHILLIKNILNNYNRFLDKYINIYGWVKNKRDFKKKSIFIDVNDGSSLNCIQIIINNELIKKELSIGSSIKIFGKLIKSKGHKQKIELIAKKINILGIVYNLNKYPLSSKKHSFEYLREITHLRSRTYIFNSISRIRNNIFYYIHKFMNKYNFLWIPTPIITKFDTEGSSDMFIIDRTLKNNKNFFGKKAFLTVSGQLNLESYACSMSKVYSFGPVFRAEKSNTKKHLAEFWMLELEISFFNLYKIINFSEFFIKKIFKEILNKNYKDIEYINNKINKNSIKKIEQYINNKFIILEYSNIINLLNKNKFNIKWGENITSYHEKFLLEKFKLPIYLIKYPYIMKPFYVKRCNKKLSLSMDLIFPEIGEIIGGSERENRLHILQKSMKLNNIKNKYYEDIRKYGSVIHSGFGMGLERLILLITGIENIRDVSAFPRFPDNINF